MAHARPHSICRRLRARIPCVRDLRVMLRVRGKCSSWHLVTCPGNSIASRRARHVLPRCVVRTRMCVLLRQLNHSVAGSYPVSVRLLFPSHAPPGKWATGQRSGRCGKVVWLEWPVHPRADGSARGDNFGNAPAFDCNSLPPYRSLPAFRDTPPKKQ